MTEITREQETAIARLAIDHASVAVTPQEDGTVKVEAGGQTLILDEDGNARPIVIERAYMALPVDLLRRMLGDDVVDAALGEAGARSYSDHSLGRILAPDVQARIVELMATSEAVRERADGPFEAAAIAADEAGEEVA